MRSLSISLWARGFGVRPLVQAEAAHMRRREWLKLAGCGALARLSGCTGQEPLGPSGRYRFGYQQTNHLRPPGSLNEENFLASCINCGVCAEVCETGAIHFYSESLGGQVEPHTPYIVAAEVACNLCLECTKICPTGALLPVEKKADVRMGLAVLEEDLCLPYIKQGGCGACYTICPVNAVRLEAQRYPKVIDERCVGCGLCEEICLTDVKAIRVVAS